MGAGEAGAAGDLRGPVGLLVPEELDVQPLLYPLDHSKEIRAVIEETETSSLIRVDCAAMPGK